MKKAILTICLILFACSAQVKAIECSSDVNNPANLKSLTTGLNSITVFQDEVNDINIISVCNQDYGPNCIFITDTITPRSWVSWQGETEFPVDVNTSSDWTDCYGNPRNPESTGIMRQRRYAPVYGLTPVGDYEEIIVYTSNGYLQNSYASLIVHVLPRKEMIAPVGFSE